MATEFLPDDIVTFKNGIFGDVVFIVEKVNEKGVYLFRKMGENSYNHQIYPVSPDDLKLLSRDQ